MENIYPVPAVPAPFLRLSWLFAGEADKKTERRVFVFPFASRWRLLACNHAQAILISWRDKENPCPAETAIVDKETFNEDARFNTALAISNPCKIDPLALVSFTPMDGTAFAEMKICNANGMETTATVGMERFGNWPWQFCGDPDGFLFGHQIARTCASPTNGYYFPFKLLSMLDLGKAGFAKWLKQYRTPGLPDPYETFASSVWLAHKPSDKDPWGGPYQAAFPRCEAGRWDFRIDSISTPRLVDYGQGHFGAPLNRMADAPVWLHYVKGLCKVE